jgi:heat shock protein HslJ
VSRVQRTAQLAAYVVLLLAANACGSEANSDGSDANPQDLSGRWTLVAATANGTPLHLDDTHPVTLTFDGTDVSGTSACNSYSGTVQVEDHAEDHAEDQAEDMAVGFSPLGGTEMACMPRSVMDLEQAYLRAMQSVVTARREADRLTLTGGDVELSFRSM